MHIGKKGFTLVEIIVSLAIMSIVAGAVGAFVIAGNNSYMRGSRELTLQEEAQLTANQLIDLIIDVERGISFQTTTGDAVNVEGNVEANGVPAAELILRNNDNVYMVRWQGGSGYDSANQLYLYEAVNGGKDADGNMIWGDPKTAAPSLMAEYVTAFNIDLTDLDKRKVKLEMTFSYQDKTYNISETIKLRNDLSGEESTDYAWITGLTINPTSATLNQGAVQNFTYKLTGDEAAVAKGVTWKVTKADGTSCKSGIDANGKLTIASDEDPGDGVLLVTCTAVADPSKVATAVINVKKVTITSLTISPKNPEVKRGEQLQFTYTMEGDESALAQGVEWKVTYADGTETAESSINVKTGLLSVGIKEISGVRRLKVTCKSVANDTMSDYTYVTVTIVKGQYNTQIIADFLKPYQYTENGIEKIGYYGDLECLTSDADYATGYPKISWDTVYEKHGEEWVRVDASDGYILEKVGEGQNIYYARIYCSYNSNVTIRVQATVQLDEKTWVYPSVDIYVPNLTTKAYIDSKQFVLYRNGMVSCELKNYDGDMNKVKWMFADDVEWELAPTREREEIIQTNPYDYGTVNPIRSERLIGFSQWDGSNDTFPSGYDDMHGGTRQLNATATGRVVHIWAKHSLPWAEEYHPLLQAYDQEGNLLAETYIVIPKCEIFFADNKRYEEITQWQEVDSGRWDGEGTLTDYKLQFRMYGVEQSNDTTKALRQAGFWVNMGVDLIGNTSSKTRIGTITISQDNSYAFFYLGNDEEARQLYLSFYDKDNKNDPDYSLDRALVIWWNRKSQ